MKLTAEISMPSFDLDAAKKALDVECKSILVEGVKAWVNTVESVLPNWSGESRGSLRPIAGLVGIMVFASPVRGAPDRVAFGESEGEAKINNENFQYSFYWQSKCFHLAYNEFNNANAVGFHLINPGPYHSQALATAAFKAVTNQKLRNLKFKIGTYIKILKQVMR